MAWARANCQDGAVKWTSRKSLLTSGYPRCDGYPKCSNPAGLGWIPKSIGLHDAMGCLRAWRPQKNRHGFVDANARRKRGCSKIKYFWSLRIFAKNDVFCRRGRRWRLRTCRCKEQGKFEGVRKLNILVVAMFCKNGCALSLATTMDGVFIFCGLDWRGLHGAKPIMSAAAGMSADRSTKSTSVDVFYAFEVRRSEPY